MKTERLLGDCCLALSGARNNFWCFNFNVIRASWRLIRNERRAVFHPPQSALLDSPAVSHAQRNGDWFRGTGLAVGGRRVAGEPAKCPAEAAIVRPPAQGAAFRA